MSAKPSQIILPGTLSQGLIGHFYTNTSLTNALINLALGAPQVAAMIGTPTLGPGYINLQVGTTYINTGLMETPALTIIMATQTTDPMVTTDVYFTYPEELRHSKRIGVFRDFLLRKVAETRF